MAVTFERIKTAVAEAKALQERRRSHNRCEMCGGCVHECQCDELADLLEPIAKEIERRNQDA